MFLPFRVSRITLSLAIIQFPSSIMLSGPTMKLKNFLRILREVLVAQPLLKFSFKVTGGNR
jgi:hypothetical protein